MEIGSTRIEAGAVTFALHRYGPRYKTERIFLDTTLVENSLDHFLGWFKDGKLPERRPSSQ